MTYFNSKIMTLLKRIERKIDRTKRGNVICKSFEIYSRNDIGCGSIFCDKCIYLYPLKPTLSKKIYLIPDLSIIKYQIDIITSPIFLSKFNVILLQTIIEKIKKINFSLYKRIESELIECNKYNASIYIFINKFNKNLSKTNIISVYKWYKSHLSLNNNNLFIITQSAKNVKLLKSLNIKSFKIDIFIKTLFPSNLSNLQDSLSSISTIINDNKNKENNKQIINYQPHWKQIRVNKELLINKDKIFRGKYFSIYGSGKNPFGKVIINDKTINIYGINNINRAIHEDIVCVKIIDFDKMEGKIVSIIKKNWRSYCGSLDCTKIDCTKLSKTKQSGFIYFIPIDNKIPKIGINTSQILNLINKRIIVNIDEWKINSKYPFGHYCETIGVIGDLECETQVLLLEHDIPYNPWSDAVLKCLPIVQDSGDVDINNISDINIRRNLINEGYSTIFSVDPIGCVDIDDALHCKQLINGNFEIGVHIADVSYYVKLNSALDREAAKRSTSVYLIDRRIDMLPSLLSTNLCSLQANKIRLSFSCFWEIKIDKKNNKYEIISTSFHRCIIKSSLALSYKQAQDIINDNKNQTKIAKSLRNLLFISKLLKKERIKNGALSLSSLQPKFKFNDKKPTSLTSYKLYETNSMIEEFMLFANISVAKKIYFTFPSFALLRRHPKPTKSMLSTLIKYASIRGFKININSSKELSLSLDKCIDKNDKSFNKLIRIITTRCMTQAIYFISGSIKNKNDFKHYGLASNIYTHFTSPIRRYCDIIVHRQLSACLKYDNNINTNNDIIKTLNRRHRLAQYINRASANLYTLIYFDNINKKIKTNAIISSIDSNCLNVYIEKYCMERRIYLKNKNEWNFDCDKLILYKITPPSIKYQIFDKIMVKIYVFTSKYHRKKLIVEIDDNDINHIHHISSQQTHVDAVPCID